MHTDLPFPARLIRAYLRTRLRGRTRLTLFLARRLKSLHSVPINIADLAPLYVDLRLPGSDELLKFSPYANSPREPEEQNLMRHVVRSGEIVFDIGASIGIHTVLLSKLVGPEGKVCAFEPNEDLLPNLSRTVTGLSNAEVYPFALSNCCAQSLLFIPVDHTMASLSGNYKSDVTHTVACDERRMADLVEASIVPRPDFIKCDVEGAELKVFEGGRKTLDRIDAPIILFELNVWSASSFGLKVGDAKDYLSSLGPPRYSFFELQGGKVVEVQSVNPQFSNLLAVPKSKLDRISELAPAKDT